MVLDLSQAESTPAGTGGYALITADQKSATTEITSVVQTKSLQQVDLGLGGVKGDAICPGDGDPSQMSGTNLNHVISTLSWQQFEMHLPRSAGHRSLTTQFGSSSRRQAQIGGHTGIIHAKQVCQVCQRGTKPRPLWIRGALPRPFITVRPATTTVVELPPSRFSASFRPSC